MKLNLQSFALLFFILLLIINSSKTHARSISTKQGEEEVKPNEITSKGSILDIEGNDSFIELMGLEISCESGDDECLKRRIVAEAHLDYIYTQHHRP